MKTLPYPPHPAPRLAFACLLLLAAAVPFLASNARAQAVWTNADDRDYTGNPPVANSTFWSYGYVAPDQNGNNGHAGNWSGNLSPGSTGGPADAYLGAPGNTFCDVNATLDSLTIAPGGVLILYRGSLTVTTTNITTAGTMVLGRGLSYYTNAGTMTVAAGTGTYTIAPDIILDSNAGSTIAVTSGTLQLPGSTGLFDTVTFSPSAGATIDLVGLGGSGAAVTLFQGTLTNGVGTGTVLLDQGTMAGTQRYLDPSLVTPCTLAFTGSVFQWTGGVIGSYQGGHLFTNAGTINLSGDNYKRNIAVFTNTGTMIQTGAGDFDTGVNNSGGSFTNAARAVYNLQSDAGLGQGGYPFTNAGLLEKTAGTGTSSADVTLTNTGTITVATGTLSFSDNINDINGTTLTEGTWNVFNGATLTFASYGALTINQANVALSGPNSNFTNFSGLTDNQGSFSLLALRQFTTAGALSNEGDLVLDAGATLHVAGAFTALGANASLAITVGGTATQGVLSPGILQVNGTATVAGNISVTFSSTAKLPSASDTLMILSATVPISGSFANVASGARINTADGKGSFLVSYGAGSSPNAVTLSQFLLPGVSPVTIPTVSLTTSVASANANEGLDGSFLLTLSAAQSEDLVVNLQIKGTAVNGTDYTLLKTTKKIKAGKTSKPINVIPTDESYYAGGKKTVKITVLPGTGYTVGGTPAAKVKIFYDR